MYLGRTRRRPEKKDGKSWTDNTIKIDDFILIFYNVSAVNFPFFYVVTTPNPPKSGMSWEPEHNQNDKSHHHLVTILRSHFLYIILLPIYQWTQNRKLEWNSKQCNSNFPTIHEYVSTAVLIRATKKEPRFCFYFFRKDPPSLINQCRQWCSGAVVGVVVIVIVVSA